ncbi:MAG: hypothetical protein WA364_26010, partial [Candidatus Nitrosopolaris sp.]
VPVVCPAGTNVTGGGYFGDVVTVSDWKVHGNRPVQAGPHNQAYWEVSAASPSNTPAPPGSSLTAYAVCTSLTP